MQHNTAFIQNLMQRLDFPKSSIEAFTRVLNRLDCEIDFAKEFDTAYIGYMFPTADQIRPALAKISRTAEKFNENEYTLHAVFLLSCMEELFNRYKLLGISEEIYWDTADDLRCKLLECIDCKGVHGIFVGFWYEGFFNMTRFTLGRFQFERKAFTREDAFITKSGYEVKENSILINMHIPSSSVPITDEVRIASYKKAYEFFRNGFNGPVVFGCCSWLLYPNHKPLLPTSSNIVKFMNDFEIVWVAHQEKFSEAWRVFGKECELPPEQLPEKTSLQRAYKKMLTDGDNGGYAMGVFLFDGEKII